MKQLIIPIIVAVCASAGGFAGQLVKSVGAKEYPDTGERSARSSNGAHEKPDRHESGEDTNKKRFESGVDGQLSYFEFRREFIVPVLSDGRVDALVIININLEVEPSLSEKLFNMEPKLRDNIMTSLVGLSSESYIFKNITDVQNYETIRSVVLANLRAEVASEIRNVLIMDVAKQGA